MATSSARTDRGPGSLLHCYVAPAVSPSTCAGLHDGLRLGGAGVGKRVQFFAFPVRRAPTELAGAERLRKTKAKLNGQLSESRPSKKPNTHGLISKGSSQAVRPPSHATPFPKTKETTRGAKDMRPMTCDPHWGAKDMRPMTCDPHWGADDMRPMTCDPH